MWREEKASLISQIPLTRVGNHPKQCTFCLGEVTGCHSWAADPREPSQPLATGGLQSGSRTDCPGPLPVPAHAVH